MEIEQIYRDILAGERSRFPTGSFSKNYRVPLGRAVRYLIEEVLQWDEEQILDKFGFSILRRHHLSGIYSSLEISVFEALDAAYPDRFKPWQLARKNKHIWSDPKTRIAAIRWLVEERLELSIDPISLSQVKRSDFLKNRLGGLLVSYGGAVHVTLSHAYPEVFGGPMKLGKNARPNFSLSISPDAPMDVLIRKCLEDELGLTEENICSKINPDMIEESSISIIFETSFSSNLVDLLDAVYPGKFRQQDIEYFKRRKMSKRTFIKRCRNGEFEHEFEGLESVR